MWVGWGLSRMIEKPVIEWMVSREEGFEEGEEISSVVGAV